MPAKSAAPEQSVAVLAFANLSDEKSNECFSDGISEELLNALASFPPDDFRRAYALAALGRYKEALPALGTVPPIALSRLYWHPMWDPLRGDPRFQQALVKLGCAAEYQVARAALARILHERNARK